MLNRGNATTGGPISGVNSVYPIGLASSPNPSANLGGIIEGESV